jgi:lysophospholipase L1-like esterase
MKHTLALLAALLLAPLATLRAEPAVTNALQHEPTNDAEVQMQNKYLDKLKPAEYAKWVAYVKSRPAEEQVWLRTLEEQLGSFYAPPYMKDLPSGKVNPETDGWAYVKDDPRLPRVLIIGESISRSYTATVRKALKDKANVHRAPANCGRTDYFFKNGEAWLKQNGSARWDVIVFNFGIHDNGKTPAQYQDNLEKILTRLRETGANVLWARTTPWGQIREKGVAGDKSVPLNRTSDAFAKARNVAMIDLHAVVYPEIARLQAKDGTHFTDEGARKLGETVARAIEAALAKK